MVSTAVDPTQRAIEGLTPETRVRTLEPRVTHVEHATVVAEVNLVVAALVS